MNKYLVEAQERAKQIWRTEAEQEAFIGGVQWLIMQPEIVKLFAIHDVNQQRELLAAFQKDYNKRNFEDALIADIDIELFLAANSG